MTVSALNDDPGKHFLALLDSIEGHYFATHDVFYPWIGPCTRKDRVFTSSELRAHMWAEDKAALVPWMAFPNNAETLAFICDDQGRVAPLFCYIKLKEYAARGNSLTPDC